VVSNRPARTHEVVEMQRQGATMIAYYTVVYRVDGRGLQPIADVIQPIVMRTVRRH
jgi:hypothetical protein